MFALATPGRPTMGGLPACNPILPATALSETTTKRPSPPVPACGRPWACGRDVQRRCAIFALSRSVVAKVAAIVSCGRVEKRVWVDEKLWMLGLFGVEDGAAGWSR